MSVLKGVQLQFRDGSTVDGEKYLQDKVFFHIKPHNKTQNIELKFKYRQRDNEHEFNKIDSNEFNEHLGSM